MTALDLLSVHLPPGSPVPEHRWSRLVPSRATYDGSDPSSDDDAEDPTGALLTRRQLDAARVHTYLLFYEEHALLWSSLEQTFPDWDEKRMNGAIAYLEEVDAVEVEPAPAPNPWSPDDALVSLSPGPNALASTSAGLPLPWPGSHIHSPQFPETPAPPPFGFNSLVPSRGGERDFTHDYPFTLPSSAHAHSRSRASTTPALRRAYSGQIDGARTMTDIFRSGFGMGLGMTGLRDITTTPTAGDIPQTITPPSSDRWFSAQPSELTTPSLRATDGGQNGISPHILARNGATIGPGKPLPDQLLSPEQRMALADDIPTDYELLNLQELPLLDLSQHRGQDELAQKAGKSSGADPAGTPRRKKALAFSDHEEGWAA